MYIFSTKTLIWEAYDLALGEVEKLAFISLDPQV